MEKKLGAIVLAAGKGSRMKLDDMNKVILPLRNKPLIQYAIDLLRSMNIDTVVVVVGHAKESVMTTLMHTNVLFAHQKKQLGTAHAVLSAMDSLPDSIENVFVLQGDDAMFYSKKVLESLIYAHENTNASLTFLTITIENPTGLGRIQRDSNGKIIKIIEEKDATSEQKKIPEVNPACYVFRVSFLKKYLKTIEKSSETGEYYLTRLIDIALEKNEKIEIVSMTNLPWRGVNTQEELQQAERILQN